MTRGQLTIITDEAIFTSLEFNGDMYPSGYGEDAIKALEKVKDFDSYVDAVEKFNRDHHNYDDEQLVYHYKNEPSMLDMSKGYFENWFSDYLYIKNLSDEDQEIIDSETKETIIVPPNGIVVLCFGRLERLIIERA